MELEDEDARARRELISRLTGHHGSYYESIDGYRFSFICTNTIEVRGTVIGYEVKVDDRLIVFSDTGHVFEWRCAAGNTETADSKWDSPVMYRPPCGDKYSGEFKLLQSGHLYR